MPVMFACRIGLTADPTPLPPNGTLSTAAQAVDDDCLRTVLGSLPEGSASLFGRPETV
ncbi:MULTISPECIES: hypothetical protein [unclassified Rhodococcus (in: high G+C Gram-positive bacteria)]|uniref:hypothetical protein n=1 Tax=unclassified Rhodococcus (in: high G+C Gram-positive bacteria) TaxID=192944 RepID=UPI0020785854|nr:MULTISPECIES: hypothetical protein [unclassified Rhodococcus (in: high G+C Gram-positive bacteria)]